ncbi:putative beta-glucanosyltransferase [Phaeomoniella chlamydospora]|uniref:1,3-beta-glucanosyltransferase n=1 Tax=Phaeomoniella chlamydospora TaxID=158046 RepID=A0A0G2EYQ9_PHACM|nr:putative beta-glucanosyltransferase [Phaeomoniella chlamydospora]
MRTGSILSAAALLATSVLGAELPVIERKGAKFFYSNNGTQFFMRGIAYQEDYSSNGTTDGSDSYIDPLASSSNCDRDIPLLQGVYTNVIRVYAINPEQDHTYCMNMLQEAGIYVVADLSSPSQSIDRSDPEWNNELYARYTSVIDVLQNWTNVIGFFAGNEVSNNASNTDASAFVKAAVRDMKAYISDQGYRSSLGVGYATNDDEEIRDNLAAYFDCGDSEDAIDFWGYNIYSWCGESTYEESGYADRTEEFSTYDVPSFFAEYGCNTQGTRTFQEITALYGDEMTEVFSGGIVYMYFQEENDYGIVSIDGSSASTMADYSNLQSQLAKVTTVTGVNSASYTPSNSPAACPTVDSDWAASSDLPPTPNTELCECMYAALTCVPDDSVDSEDYGDLFGVVCGLSSDACEGIQSNATTGEYGAYEMCNSKQQLGWALNAYYSEQTSKGNAGGCSFSGSATTQSASSPTGSCKTLISQAGSLGTGSVTSSPSGTGSSGSSETTDGSGSGSASGSGSGVGGFIAPSVSFGIFQVGLYLVCAIGSGVAMIVL